jgi:hypothetical protein
MSEKTSKACQQVRYHLTIPLFLVAVVTIASAGLRIAHLGDPMSWSVLVAGITLAFCCVGLWNAREWARWPSAAICAALFLVAIRVPQPRWTNYVNLFVLLLASVYLVAPSTGKLFARARGDRSNHPRAGDVER